MNAEFRYEIKDERIRKVVAGMTSAFQVLNIK